MNAPTSHTIGIVGSGVMGSRVAISLQSAGHRARIAHVPHATDLHDCQVVVLAQGGKHAPMAATFLAEGISVVSVSDNLADVLALIDLQEKAVAKNATLIVGAACMPGMSGLLVSHVTRAFHSVDEVHTAVHGTGGPLCARQHHDSLAGTSIGWHDGEWLQRPAGSGRELCWFPDPVGARDCYRFATPEPVLMQRINKNLHRITARVSATRRDRLTARLPMLTPPHAEGVLGGLRVEVRGVRDGKRHVEIVGVADRLATVGGAVAAHTAIAVLNNPMGPGVFNLGQPEVPNADILDAVVGSGITLHQFVGK